MSNSCDSNSCVSDSCNSNSCVSDSCDSNSCVSESCYLTSPIPTVVIQAAAIQTVDQENIQIIDNNRILSFFGRVHSEIKRYKITKSCEFDHKNCKKKRHFMYV